MECPNSNENELNIDCKYYNLQDIMEKIQDHFNGIELKDLEISIEEYCTTTDYSCSSDYRQYFCIRRNENAN